MIIVIFLKKLMLNCAKRICMGFYNDTDIFAVSATHATNDRNIQYSYGAKNKLIPLFAAL